MEIKQIDPVAEAVWLGTQSRTVDVMRNLYRRYGAGVIDVVGDLHLRVGGRLIIEAGSHIFINSGGQRPGHALPAGLWLNTPHDGKEPVLRRLAYKDRPSTQRLQRKIRPKRGHVGCKCCGG